MRLSRARRPDEDRTTVPLDEIAVEQPHDRRLGNPLGEVEIILLQGLSLGEPCLSQPSLESSLLATAGFETEKPSQYLQHRAPFAGRFIQHLAIGPGDL